MWSLHPGLDTKPLNARFELQKPMPLLTDLLKHVLTSYRLSRRLSQFLRIYHARHVRSMACLQIPWAVFVQIVLVKCLLLYFLFCFVNYKPPTQIPTGNANNNMPLYADI